MSESRFARVRRRPPSNHEEGRYCGECDLTHPSGRQNHAARTGGTVESPTPPEGESGCVLRLPAHCSDSWHALSESHKQQEPRP